MSKTLILTAMEKPSIFLVFWDIKEFQSYPRDHPQFTFIECNGPTDFFDRAKKYSYALLIIKDKSTVSSVGDGKITMEIVEKYLIDYNVKHMTVFLSETSIEESIRSFIS